KAIREALGLLPPEGELFVGRPSFGTVWRQKRRCVLGSFFKRGRSHLLELLKTQRLFYCLAMNQPCTRSCSNLAIKAGSSSMRRKVSRTPRLRNSSSLSGTGQ